MEVICRILKVEPLRQRTFLDRNNTTQVINERQLHISSGASHFIGTMVGQAATSFNEQDSEWTQVACMCSFDVVSRTYTNDKGESYFTDVRINRIEKL